MIDETIPRMRPWDHWYHCMGNTYGTWLPGDPRGFRTWHHREHVDGDYRNPPPKGTHDWRFQDSKDAMKREPIFLSEEQRKRAVDEFVKSFSKWRIQVIAISIDRVHFHVLGRFPRDNPRHFLGLVKKESSAYMKQAQLASLGGLWATRTECKPINDASHHANVTQYILDHAKKGAVVWEPAHNSDLGDFDPDSLLIDR